MSRDISPLKKHIEEAPKLRELREKRKAKKKRTAIWIAIAVAVLLGGTIAAAHIPRIQITSVVVKGNQVVDTDDVLKVADAVLAGSYAYVIPRHNTFVYPKQALTRTIASSFPRFRSVAVYRGDLHTVVIDVTELRGRSLWCGTTPTIDMSAQCYFTDDSGKIVSIAPQYSGNVYPRFFGGGARIGTNSPLGAYFLDSAPFHELINFQERMQTLGFSVKGITLGSDEYDIVLDVGKGKMAPIRFKPDADFEAIEEDLELALAKPELAQAVKKDKVNLEYLDLRFDNKVYYKFSDQP